MQECTLPTLGKEARKQVTATRSTFSRGVVEWSAHVCTLPATYPASDVPRLDWTLLWFLDCSPSSSLLGLYPIKKGPRWLAAPLSSRSRNRAGHIDWPRPWTLWPGSVATLCGWALWPGLVLLLSLSCPAVVLLLSSSCPSLVLLLSSRCRCRGRPDPELLL